VTAPISGLGIAAGALRANERRMEVVANNLANVSTDGFKAQRTFAQLLDAAQGVPAISTRADTSIGTINDTGAALDLAIDGEGFAVISTTAGERWVRPGAMKLDAANRLSINGAPVLGESGTITIPTTYDKLTVQPDGSVVVDGVFLDRLRLETSSGSDLDLGREEKGTFVPSATRVAVAEGDRNFRQGALESSNVEPVSAMVEMLGIQRHHALLERAIRVLDEARETAASQLGKPV
jgi:flagellar basal body rod protein FlgG